MEAAAAEQLKPESGYVYDLNRKRRKPNFTEPELLTLVELWAQYKTILRGPATDTVMRSTKARVWRKVSCWKALALHRLALVSSISPEPRSILSFLHRSTETSV